MQYSSSSDSETPITPETDPQIDGVFDDFKEENTSQRDSASSERRGSKIPISQGPEDGGSILIRKGEVNTKLIEKFSCGGDCCFLDTLGNDPALKSSTFVVVPDNDAFRSLGLKFGPLSLDSELPKTAGVLPGKVHFTKLPSDATPELSIVQQHPLGFVTLHFPYKVYPTKVHHATELPKPGTEKRTHHFDLDATDYPEESGQVDFVVGGTVGICALSSETSGRNLEFPRHTRICAGQASHYEEQVEDDLGRRHAARGSNHSQRAPYLVL